MIPRYTHPDMEAIWTDDYRYQIWLDVETLALEGMVKEGLAPKEAYDAIKENGAFETSRVLEIEQEVKHDVIAFLTNVAEHVGPLSRYVHRGMTSNDLLDTTFALQLKRAGEMILSHVDSLLDVIWKRAEEHKHTPTIGRSHGIHAEPTTFGIKLASWYAEVKRGRARIQSALDDVAVGKLAGAVGTYASLPPAVEAHVMSELGLKPETVATQVVSRDRHAAFFSSLALLATSIERFAVEIRHLQRTEVGEAEEKFAKGQKGSSAMPHKRNPILSENLTGLARLVRSYSEVALQNVPLWHERDISHSSAERVIAPDATIVIDFMLRRFTSLVENLVIYPEKMKENLNMTLGLYMSGTLLIALVDNGMTREDAYRVVQGHAMTSWQNRENFPDRVKKDQELCNLLGQEKLDEVFNEDRHFAYVDFIFERAKKA